MDRPAFIDLGDVSRPATVLIEKVSDAVGGIFSLYQIKRTAKAQAEAAVIQAVAEIEVTGLQRRAANRWLREQADQQNNIESITQGAIPQLSQTARPEGVERDWLVKFFAEARMISDPDVQDLWSKILAGEANAPGSFSKRTITMLASLDKVDASLFDALSSLIWKVGGEVFPLVFDTDADIYTNHGLNFEALQHLDSIGLTSLSPHTGYRVTHLPKSVPASHRSATVTVTFAAEANNQLNIGRVVLTPVGKELARICNTREAPDGFPEYVIGQWNSGGTTAVRQ